MSESNNYVNLTTETKGELKRALTKTIVEFCAKDIRPMEIVSGKGFMRLVQHIMSIGATYGNIDISTILPHPTTVSRNVAKVKKEIHQKIFPIIEKAMEKGECSATTDMWTEDYKKKAFITLTVHFFDDKFTLQKNVLFTSFFKFKSKTGKNVKKEILRRFTELGYKKKLLVKMRFVTDQGSNVVKALKHPYLRDDCRAHLLNTVLRNTFESDNVPLIFLKTLITCKNIVRHLKQSGKSSELPHAVQQQCETRWNTRLKILNSITKQHPEIRALLTDKQNERWKIDIDLIEDIIVFLTPFEEATKALEGDLNPTANKVLLYWVEISEHLDQSKFTNRAMKLIVEVARKYFISKFKITMDTKIACFLDPRYRFLKMLPDNERDEVYTEVKRVMTDLSISQLNDDSCEPPPSKKSRFSVFEADLGVLEVEKEFHLYMKTANCSEYLQSDDNKKFFIELFWRANRICFPMLSKLARQRLAVPASSGPSERVFSDAGQYYTSRSTNLKPELLDDLLFIRNNLQM